MEVDEDVDATANEGSTEEGAAADAEAAPAHESTKPSRGRKRVASEPPAAASSAKRQTRSSRSRSSSLESRPRSDDESTQPPTGKGKRARVSSATQVPAIPESDAAAACESTQAAAAAANGSLPATQGRLTRSNSAEREAAAAAATSQPATTGKLPDRRTSMRVTLSASAAATATTASKSGQQSGSGGGGGASSSSAATNRNRQSLGFSLPSNRIREMTQALSADPGAAPPPLPSPLPPPMRPSHAPASSKGKAPANSAAGGPGGKPPRHPYSAGGGGGSGAGAFNGGGSSGGGGGGSLPAAAAAAADQGHEQREQEDDVDLLLPARPEASGAIVAVMRLVALCTASLLGIALVLRLVTSVASGTAWWARSSSAGGRAMSGQPEIFASFRAAFERESKIREVRSLLKKQNDILNSAEDRADCIRNRIAELRALLVRWKDQAVLLSSQLPSAAAGDAGDSALPVEVVSASSSSLDAAAMSELLKEIRDMRSDADAAFAATSRLVSSAVSTIKASATAFSSQRTHENNEESELEAGAGLDELDAARNALESAKLRHQRNADRLYEAMVATEALGDVIVGVVEREEYGNWTEKLSSEVIAAAEAAASQTTAAQSEATAAALRQSIDAAAARIAHDRALQDVTGETAVTDESEVLALVRRRLELLAVGGVAMPDYASVRAGAKVVHGGHAATSQDYADQILPWADWLLHKLRWPGRVLSEPPEAALSQGYVTDEDFDVSASAAALGRCWAFRGDHGVLTVKLGQAIEPTHFTIVHTPPDAGAKSLPYAPQVFRVDGWLADPAFPASMPIPLAEGVFSIEKMLNATRGGDSGDALPHVQTFPVHGATMGRLFEYVTLSVDSNHGEPRFTCLHGFKAHGRPAKRAAESGAATASR